jgi:hypothetical protein
MSRTIKFVLLMGLILLLALSACGTPAPTEAPVVEAPAATEAPAAMEAPVAEAPSTEPILTVSGAVDTELALSEADLRGMEVVQLNAEHPKKGPTDYEGVRLSEVLAKAGVKDGATVLLFVASDGYESEVPYADVEACTDCLVAFDGSDLIMVMPGMSSKAWAKMVAKIEVKGGAAAEAPAEVALKVTGAVASEQAWTEADVKAMKTLDVEATNSKGEKETYTGVQITDLLALAQPNADAATVVFVADDGFTAEVGLAELSACTNCILSFRSKGGFSSVLPDFDGSLQVKGVVEIQVK